MISQYDMGKQNVSLISPKVKIEVVSHILIFCVSSNYFAFDSVEICQINTISCFQSVTMIILLVQSYYWVFLFWTDVF